MPGYFCKIMAYKNGGDIDDEPYRGLNGGIAVASVLLFSSKHSWESWGANFNYMALTDPKENLLGNILIDSVLIYYKETVAIAMGNRGQKDFYGTQAWQPESNGEIGKATTKAILLIAYVFAPIHRNAAKVGSADINLWLLKEQCIG